ncbi:hypothetical protein R2103_08640 [Nitrosomonas sp. Is24]|uniref:hypothetical protein n=1 Tax=Nitrosomonas sp. Is24 TaxID=3080533 RepID=UPI00294B181F|nr:hypothetical protein [Nitrosomonas sp. Is24]MDV6341833.1 hypothetical protein [Nitrosomonas sp. Is24]
MRQIANALELGQLSGENKQFLIEALRNIADGKDAKMALNVKAKRGERTSKSSQNKAKDSDFIKRLALGWIAAALTPVKSGGLGLTLEKAVGKIGEHNLRSFGLTEETLSTYWSKNPNLRHIEFTLPD